MKDGLEAFIQASKSDVGLKKLSDFFHDGVSPELYDRFLEERKKQHSNELWEHAFKQKMFTDILEDQAKSQFKIVFEVLLSCLGIPHSFLRGNLFLTYIVLILFLVAFLIYLII